jgi:demethylmenaquinone methyltransferase/2-methoxy-6-polyprenyl-1,4-benzoquinol methylase
MPNVVDRGQEIQGMFDGIAPWYDPMNRRISLGLDLYWRWRTIRILQRDPYTRLLDVGAGTADLSIAVARQGPVHPVGVDFSRGMLELGQTKVAQAGLAQQVALVQGNAQQLPFPANSFDVVINGFLLRNLTDMKAAFAEMARVVRPGGRLLCLELTYPRFAPWRLITRFHSERIIPLLGRWLTRAAPAYRYLPASIARFPPPDKVLCRMEEQGWTPARPRYLFPGTVILYTATRRTAP